MSRTAWTVREVVAIWRLSGDPASWRFCRDVYLRSWPETARGVYSEQEILARFEQVADDAFWAEHIGEVDAPGVCRVGGSVLVGDVERFGFAVCERCEGGWDFAWLFVEPEAFGRGLADELYEAVMRCAMDLDDAEGLDEIRWTAWVLEGNLRSRGFLSRRGWIPRAGDQPTWALELGHHYQLYELP